MKDFFVGQTRNFFE